MDAQVARAEHPSQRSDAREPRSRGLLSSCRTMSMGEQPAEPALHPSPHTEIDAKRLVSPGIAVDARPTSAHRCSTHESDRQPFGLVLAGGCTEQRREGACTDLTLDSVAREPLLGLLGRERSELN